MNRHARLDERPIPFIDVAAQRRRLGGAVDEAIARVLAHCQFIQGPEVRALESELAAFCGARHAIATSSGTDALRLVLMAWGIGPGDAVICPAFTFCATAEVAALCGATPVMADVTAETFNLDPASCARAVATAKRLGLKPRAVIPVDLFGLPADHDAIAAFAAAHGMQVLDDAAQAFGATYRARKLGTLATATATSFFPAKPLGCYGDGGAIFTDDDALAERLRSLRVHGEGADKYDAARVGITGRLAPGRRDTLAAALKDRGIPTAIYYAKPLHRQAAYRGFPVAEGGLPASEQLAEEVISLPMHAYLDQPVQDRIIAAVRQALAG
jgi:dTDP-4-amino-4,6-dideoxygalactose transaminase